ncbi:MAG: outer membrane beta-barrel protein [Campylobacterota bacterium]|nr:outer membrane beta-barrel protein [Campylobacterota bacterium]
MKKIVLVVLMMSSLLLASGKTVAPLVVIEEVKQEHIFYVGGSVAALSMRYSDVDRNFFDITNGQDRLGNFVLHGGYWITEYLAIEGRYSLGFQDEDAIEMDNAWSIFLKPTYKFDDGENRVYGKNYFSIYGLLGYGNVSFKGVNNTSGDVDNGDFQWGLGLSYTFRELSNNTEYPYRDNWSIFVDYTVLGSDMEGIFEGVSDRNTDLDAITVGIAYYF